MEDVYAQLRVSYGQKQSVNTWMAHQKTTERWLYQAIFMWRFDERIAEEIIRLNKARYV